MKSATVLPRSDMLIRDREDAMRRAKGFSLIELLIVVAVILVIAAIAVPNLLRSRMAANEAAAVQSLRVVNSAQISYNSTYQTVGYASTLSALGGDCTSATPSSTAACLIDSVLAGGIKSGYSFTVTPGSGTPNQNYTVIASPVSSNYTGVRYFCSFEDAVVRFSMTAIATCDNTVTAIQ